MARHCWRINLIIIALIVLAAFIIALIVRTVRSRGIDSPAVYGLVYIGGILSALLYGAFQPGGLSLSRDLLIGAAVLGPFFCFAWRFNLWRGVRGR